MIYGRDILRRKIEYKANKLENGDYVEYKYDWSDPILCDAYPSAGKRYSYEVHLDVSEAPFELGSQVELCANGHKEVYTVLGYHRYSFIAKLWL